MKNYQTIKSPFSANTSRGLLIGLAIAMYLAVPSILFAQADDTKKGYASVNDLKMYYDIHGEDSGKPALLLLHGAFGTIEGWEHILPDLTKTRQVIMVEQQGHGHTPDRDEPLSYDQMADDTAALLEQINVKHVDVFGYSDGGVVGLRLAMKHPELVRKLAILGSNTGSLQATYEKESYEQFLNLPDDFAPPVLTEPYNRVAPDTSNWPVLVKKIKQLGREFPGFPEEDVKSITAPTLIMQGDDDVVKPEHGAEIMRLIPNSQLAVFPGGDHFVLYTNPDTVVKTFMTFFDASTTKDEK